MRVCNSFREGVPQRILLDFSTRFFTTLAEAGRALRRAQYAHGDRVTDLPPATAHPLYPAAAGRDCTSGDSCRAPFDRIHSNLPTLANDITRRQRVQQGVEAIDAQPLEAPWRHMRDACSHREDMRVDVSNSPHVPTQNPQDVVPRDEIDRLRTHGRGRGVRSAARQRGADNRCVREKSCRLEISGEDTSLLRNTPAKITAITGVSTRVVAERSPRSPAARTALYAQRGNQSSARYLAVINTDHHPAIAATTEQLLHLEITAGGTRAVVGHLFAPHDSATPGLDPSRHR